MLRLSVPRFTELLLQRLLPRSALHEVGRDTAITLRSEKDAEFSIGAAREGTLKGNLKGHNDLTLICVPPTRLAGPCRKVLTHMLKKILMENLGTLVSRLTH